MRPERLSQVSLAERALLTPRWTCAQLNGAARRVLLHMRSAPISRWVMAITPWFMPAALVIDPPMLPPEESIIRALNAQESRITQKEGRPIPWYIGAYPGQA